MIYWAEQDTRGEPRRFALRTAVETGITFADALVAAFGEAMINACFEIEGRTRGTRDLCFIADHDNRPRAYTWNQQTGAILTVEQDMPPLR